MPDGSTVLVEPVLRGPPRPTDSLLRRLAQERCGVSRKVSSRRSPGDACLACEGWCGNAKTWKIRSSTWVNGSASRLPAPPLDSGQTQQYCCLVPLPELTSAGLLPPGEHPATWSELYEAFGTTRWRRDLLDGLRRACDSLAVAGCRIVWLDGSFVTSADPPGDFDGCWDPVGVDPALLDPVLLDFTQGRAAQKAIYGGELFPASSLAAPGGPVFLQFFQVDKHTGARKGIVALDPRSTK